MIRTSNRRNAGSRRNKKHRFVPTQAKDHSVKCMLNVVMEDINSGDVAFVVWTRKRRVESPFTWKNKPNHKARTTHIGTVTTPIIIKGVLRGMNK